MKLSDAMREGAKHSRQCFGISSQIGRDGKAEKCALSCMRTVLNTFDEIKKHGELLLVESPADCPADCQHTAWGYAIGNVIIHLNDNHRWSRERIADWLESVGL